MKTRYRIFRIKDDRSLVLAKFHNTENGFSSHEEAEKALEKLLDKETQVTYLIMPAYSYNKIVKSEKATIYTFKDMHKCIEKINEFIQQSEYVSWAYGIFSDDKFDILKGPTKIKIYSYQLVL